MTLRHLRIFVAVCETGSVTAAGEKLFIAQPSVSLAISELENFYGLKLFDRLSKRMYLTESGKRFLQYATHIVSLFDDLESETKNYDATGVIRIGTSITIGNCLLIEYIKAFKDIHPYIKVHVSINNSYSIEQEILNNHLDIGLIEGEVHSTYIKSEAFMDDELVLISSTKHPLAELGIVGIDMLKSEDFILREKGSAGREIFDAVMAASGIEIVPLWESISTQAIFRAVSADLGLSVLPYLLVKDYVDRNEIKIIEITGISLRRKFNIIYHKNKFITKSAKDFIDLCK